MIKQFIEQIGGIAVLGTISICLFFVVFGAALVWAFCLDRSFLKKMGALPLNDEPATKGDRSHE